MASFDLHYKAGRGGGQVGLTRFYLLVRGGVSSDLSRTSLPLLLARPEQGQRFDGRSHAQRIAMAHLSGRASFPLRPRGGGEGEKGVERVNTPPAFSHQHPLDPSQRARGPEILGPRIALGIATTLMQAAGSALASAMCLRYHGRCLSVPGSCSEWVQPRGGPPHPSPCPSPLPLACGDGRGEGRDGIALSPLPAATGEGRKGQSLYPKSKHEPPCPF